MLVQYMWVSLSVCHTPVLYQYSSFVSVFLLLYVTSLVLNLSVPMIFLQVYLQMLLDCTTLLSAKSTKSIEKVQRRFTWMKPSVSNIWLLLDSLYAVLCHAFLVSCISYLLVTAFFAINKFFVAQLMNFVRISVPC